MEGVCCSTHISETSTDEVEGAGEETRIVTPRKLVIRAQITMCVQYLGTWPRIIFFSDSTKY